MVVVRQEREKSMLNQDNLLTKQETGIFALKYQSQYLYIGRYK